MSKSEKAAQIEFVKYADVGHDGKVLITSAGAVWVTFAPPWFAWWSWIWWMLTTKEKRWVVINDPEPCCSGKIRVRAYRLAKTSHALR